MGNCLAGGNKFHNNLEIRSPSPEPGLIYRDSQPPIKNGVQRTLIFDMPGEAAEERNSEEKALKNIIPGKDGRERVDNAEIWPSSVHGRLFMKFQGENFVGSGTLIGPRYVLTAAHNLYDKKSQQECDKDSVIFIPAMCGISCPYGKVKVVEWHYPQEYKIEGKEDYALLILQEDIGKYTGMYGLKGHSRYHLNNIECNLYGYPANMKDQNPNHHYLWGMRGPISIDVMENKINYEIDTSSGQSGSAIWYSENDKYYIVGVHTSGTYINNSGIYLNESRLKKIVAWMILSESNTVKIKNHIGQVTEEVKTNFNVETISLPGILRNPIILESDIKADESTEFKEVAVEFKSETVKRVYFSLPPFSYNLPEPNGVTKKGPVTLSDESVYIGSWKDNQINGTGIMHYVDGRFAEGYWENGKMHGFGRIIYSNGDHYEGEWSEGKRHGKGKLVNVTTQGEYYGDWQFDNQHGKGKETWEDGSYYEGDFLDGTKTGKGQFRWGDSSEYFGDFKNNEIEGDGHYIWADGREYWGSWKENKLHGKGKFTWVDGRIYEGEFNMDKKHGYGVFTWPDGKFYEGSWKNGKQDGDGTFRLPGEIPRIGEFKDGKLVTWLE
jgi:V8-like Glu-specific endopeptidase